MTEVTARLAEFTSGLDWERVPERVRAIVRGMVRDCLGVAMAGSLEPEFLRLKSVEPCTGDSVTGLQEAGSLAVLVSTAAHALDYDDIHLAMGGHPSSVVIGAVLAAADEVDATAADTYAGFLAGVETAARIGRAISAGHYHVGWHPTSVIGALAAAVGAARVMRLDTLQTQRALGLAAAMASGTKANFGTFAKPLQVGSASRAGLVSAFYSRAGLTANETILDDQHGGFTQLFTESVDEAAIVGDLGVSYSITEPDPVIKLMPACGGVHAASWAAIDLAEDLDLHPDQVASIDVEVHSKRIPHTNRPTIVSGLEGKFSTQYCVAVAITQRRVTLADFDNDVIFEGARQSVMRKTTLRAAPDADEWPGATEYSTGTRGARVTVELVDGTRHQRFLGAAPGYPGNQATEIQLEGKFLDCVSRAASEVEARRWYGDLAQDGVAGRQAMRQIAHAIACARPQDF